MQTTLSFPSGIYWRSIVKQKTKETFCFAKLWSQYNTFEGFSRKRGLGILFKTELCQKRSKFHMQFCLVALNNVLHVCLQKFALFLRYYVCKKPVFVVTSACDRKDHHFTSSPAKYWLTLKDVDFSWKTLKLLISGYHATAKALILLKLQSNVNFTWFHVKAWQQGSWFHLKMRKLFNSHSA